MQTPVHVWWTLLGSAVLTSTVPHDTKQGGHVCSIPLLQKMLKSSLPIRAQVGINCAVFTDRGVYPTADAIDEAREMAKRVGAASIVGIGGGGAIDTAKATARLHASR